MGLQGGSRLVNDLDYGERVRVGSVARRPVTRLKSEGSSVFLKYHFRTMNSSILGGPLRDLESR